MIYFRQTRGDCKKRNLEVLGKFYNISYHISFDSVFYNNLKTPSENQVFF